MTKVIIILEATYDDAVEDIYYLHTPLRFQIQFRDN